MAMHFSLASLYDPTIDGHFIALPVDPSIHQTHAQSIRSKTPHMGGRYKQSEKLEC